MSELAAMTVEEASLRADRARLANMPAEAMELLGPLLAGAYGSLTPKQTWAAMSNAFKCLTALGDWTTLLDLANRATTEFPGNARGWRRAGEALHHLGQRDLAIARLRHAVHMDPSDVEARDLLRIVSDRSTPPPRAPVRPWPSSLKAFGEPRETVRRYLLRGRDDPKFITRRSSFVTMGSCFARELAARLAAAGRSVHYESIGEEVNSTFANRRLLEWLEHGPVDAASDAIEVGFGAPVRARLAAAIADADVVILTLGVAPCFFHHATGEFAIAPKLVSVTARDYLNSHHVMRTTTVAQNVENLVAIAESLRRLAARPLQMVLTVSPVPLQGTTEMASAIEADCLSKSTLRVACQEALADPALAGAVYWPSFELVRWLAPYWGPAQPLVYGAEDGSPWHVSNWLVDLIVETFLEHFSAPDGVNGDLKVDAAGADLGARVHGPHI